MRKLIVSNIMSLDGYFEGPGKDVMVLPLDEAFDAYNAERLRAADTLLPGRTTYEGLGWGMGADLIRPPCCEGTSPSRLYLAATTGRRSCRINHT
jgi:hypothetical protein